MASPAYAACQVGILGVGSLGRALTVGLLTSKCPPTKAVLLSTDGGSTPTHSAALSKTYGAKVALASNAEVATKSDLLFICVPPDAVSTVLKDVCLRESQIVISVAAIFPVTQLASLVKPAAAVRTLPMVSSEFHSSFTLVCFGEDWNTPKKGCPLERKQVIEFLEVFGDVVMAEDDKQLDALGFAGLHQKSMLAFLQSMQITLQGQGVPPLLAAQTVSKQMRAVCDDAARAADGGSERWQQLGKRGCRGELNQLVCDVLTFCGLFSSYRLALSIIGFAKTVTEASKAKVAMGAALAVAAVASMYSVMK